MVDLCLCLHDNHARDDLATGLSRHVLDGRAQVRGRDAHLLGIKGHVALMRIMLQYQFAKGFADLLSCPQGRHRVLLPHTDLTYSFQDQVNLIFNQLTVVQLSTLETDQQQLQIIPYQLLVFLLQVDRRMLINDLGDEAYCTNSYE